MALIIKDRVQETSTTSGTGTLTLAGAVTGYQSFGSAIGNGNTTYYGIYANGYADWEVGIGTVTVTGGTTTLARTTVLASSNAGSLVNFSGAQLSVWGDMPAAKGAYFDLNGNLTTNCLFEGFTSQAASGTTITLTASSVQNWTITGSGGQTIQLPDATTLPNGALFTFNNNQSSGTIVVKNNSGTTVCTTQSGAFISVTLLSNSIAAGSWDYHNVAPSNASWSTNTLSWAGSYTNGTWNGNVITGAYGGTGLTTFTAANNALYSTGATTLTAGTLPVLAGGTGVTTSTGSGSVVLNTSPNINTPTITGGTIDNTVIGATTPNTGTFTTITGQTEVLKGTGENFMLYSQQFSNAAWVKQTGVTATDNAVIAPDGSTTAASIAWSTTATGQGIYQVKTGLSWTGLTNTKSIYIRADVAGGTVDFTDPGLTGATNTFTLTTSWQRISLTEAYQSSAAGVWVKKTASSPSTVYIWGGQLEIGTSASTYTVTTSAAIYGTPTLSFSGVAGLGLQSDGSLYVSPAGTGALQAQATTSSTVGGNARGANAVDWQTGRGGATQVASGSNAFIGGGYGNTVSNSFSAIGGGGSNVVNQPYASILGGQNNTATLNYSAVVGGYSNNGTGFYGLVGGGASNSTTSSSAVTTQSATMNGTTTVTLAASNANIKVGQLITGTYITFPTTYVAAISGTTLTLSQVASGSGTATLSFYTPHGVVVGGGNNQATGSYSFIGGGGDAGTAANRNVASGDWSSVVGGTKNTASGLQAAVLSGASNTASGNSAVVCGGGTYGAYSYSANTSSGQSSFVGAGWGNTNSSFGGVLVGGNTNTVNGPYSAILAGGYGTTRGLIANHVIPSFNAVATTGGAQSAILVLGKQTTDATATVITSDGGAAGTTNQVILPNNSAYYFKASIISGVTGGGNSKAWTIEGLIKRGANAASTALVGTPVVNTIAADSGASTWTVTATADTTNGGLAITFTGQAGTTIRTVAKIETTEMTY